MSVVCFHHQFRNPILAFMSRFGGRKSNRLRFARVITRTSRFSVAQFSATIMSHAGGWKTPASGFRTLSGFQIFRSKQQNSIVRLMVLSPQRTTWIMVVLERSLTRKVKFKIVCFCLSQIRNTEIENSRNRPIFWRTAQLLRCLELTMQF